MNDSHHLKEAAHWTAKADEAERAAAGLFVLASIAESSPPLAQALIAAADYLCHEGVTGVEQIRELAADAVKDRDLWRDLAKQRGAKG